MNVSKDVLQSEIEVAKNCILQSTDENYITLNDVKKILTKQTFLNLYKLFQVALTIPISSSTFERSFSAMFRIKTWLRTSMLQERSITPQYYILKKKFLNLLILKQLLIYLHKKIDIYNYNKNYLVAIQHFIFFFVPITYI